MGDIDDIEHSYAFGFLHYGAGHWNEAADVFRTLCIKRPLDSRFWFGLGATLQEACSYTDALHAWAMVSLLRAEDPNPHFHAAECYFSMQKSAEAAKALHEAEMRMQGDHPLKDRIQLLKQQWGV